MISSITQPARFCLQPPGSSNRQPSGRLLGNLPDRRIRRFSGRQTPISRSGLNIPKPGKMWITPPATTSIAQLPRRFPQIAAKLRLSHNPGPSIRQLPARLLHNRQFVYEATKSPGNPRRCSLTQNVTRARGFNFFFLTALTPRRLQGLRPAGSCLRQPDPTGLPTRRPRATPSAYGIHPDRGPQRGPNSPPTPSLGANRPSAATAAQRRKPQQSVKESAAAKVGSTVSIPDWTPIEKTYRMGGLSLVVRKTQTLQN